MALPHTLLLPIPSSWNEVATSTEREGMQGGDGKGENGKGREGRGGEWSGGYPMCIFKFFLK